MHLVIITIIITIITIIIMKSCYSRTVGLSQRIVAFVVNCAIEITILTYFLTYLLIVISLSIGYDRNRSIYIWHCAKSFSEQYQ